MNIKKFLLKLTGKQQEPEVNRVQVDINYVESYVNSDKFYGSPLELEETDKQDENITQ